MAFTEKKFRALPFSNQAKKIADLLADLALELVSSSADANANIETRAASREKRLNEIERLQSFARQNAREADPNNRNASPGPRAGLDRAPRSPFIDARSLYAAYLYWRKQAGLGAERKILHAFARLSENENDGEQDYESTLSSGDASEARGPIVNYSVWLHDIRSGYNAGAVLRTAECFGFRRAFLSGFTPGPEHAAVRSAAMGCEAWLECVRLNLREGETGETNRDAADPDAVKPMRPPNTPTLIALESPNTALPPDSRAGAIQAYNEFDWPDRATLVVGNEELGVDARILAEADAVLAIPMYGRKASLNLASSFAIVAAHARACLERRQ